MVDFPKTCRKWKHQDDSVEDGPSEKAVGAGGAADGLTEALAGWEFLTIWAAELDAGDESTLTNLVDE